MSTPGDLASEILMMDTTDVMEKTAASIRAGMDSIHSHLSSFVYWNVPCELGAKK